MMQELIDTLNDKQASLVILHEGKIHSFQARCQSCGALRCQDDGRRRHHGGVG